MTSLRKSYLCINPNNIRGVGVVAKHATQFQIGEKIITKSSQTLGIITQVATYL